MGDFLKFFVITSDFQVFVVDNKRKNLSESESESIREVVSFMVIVGGKSNSNLPSRFSHYYTLRFTF